MTERRWIADAWDASSATLTGAQAQHLARVLRGEPGQRAHVVAGGRVWSAVIRSIRDEEVVFTLEDELERAEALPVSLLLAVFKFDRMEWAIEKATELGVAGIAPVITRRTEKHLAQAAEKRQERWHRIAFEAAKQSRRAGVPSFMPLCTLRQALDAPRNGARVLLSESEHKQPLLRAVEAARSELTLATGPEGGWTSDELALFMERQWQPVTLGPHILRAETAAIAAVAVAAAVLRGQASAPLA